MGEYSTLGCNCISAVVGVFSCLVVAGADINEEEDEEENATDIEEARDALSLLTVFLVFFLLRFAVVTVRVLVAVEEAFLRIALLSARIPRPSVILFRFPSAIVAV